MNSAVQAEQVVRVAVAGRVEAGGALGEEVADAVASGGEAEEQGADLAGVDLDRAQRGGRLHALVGRQGRAGC